MNTQTMTENKQYLSYVTTFEFNFDRITRQHKQEQFLSTTPSLEALAHDMLGDDCSFVQSGKVHGNPRNLPDRWYAGRFISNLVESHASCGLADVKCYGSL